MSRAAPDEEYPKTVVLKDGAHLVLRLATAADEPALGARFGGDAMAPEAIRVVAVDGDRLAGVTVLARGGGPDERRVAVLLDAEYAGRRLGTWMLLDAVHLATALELERLVAEVAADEGGLLAALRRLDFTDAGAAGGCRRLVKVLHAAWTDF